MKEIREIIHSYEAALEQGKKTALATVVHVQGSSYRRPGARMLITEEGRLTGAISGGCLEGDAMRKALHVIREQRPALVTYDTMDEDDATIGIGLGCNGIIQVLIEPILPEDPFNPMVLLKMTNAKRQTSLLATCFLLSDRRAPQPGTRMYLDQGGEIFGEIPVARARWQADAEHALASGESQWLHYDTPTGEMTVFFEVLPPPVSLVIVGAGNDVMPLVNIADLLGWEATVVDGRANYAKPERFAKACQVLVAKPGQVLQQIPIDDQTVFALMTHNYNYDKAMLFELCRQQARYIAMLGPKKKLERMLAEFEDAGTPLSPEQLATIYSPAGLDLGAATPEGIALSIAAEIQAHFGGRRGGFLRDRELPIYDSKPLLIHGS